MSFSLVYLVQRFFYRIARFVWDWYIGGFFFIGRHTINLFEQLDRIFAWRITLRYFFQPLYGDYSIIGRALGFIFRTIRLFIGAIVYLIVITIAFAIYIVWIGIPIIIIYDGFVDPIFTNYLINFQ